jgi:hypothetical protein
MGIFTTETRWAAERKRIALTLTLSPQERGQQRRVTVIRGLFSPTSDVGGSGIRHSLPAFAEATARQASCPTESKVHGESCPLGGLLDYHPSLFHDIGALSRVLCFLG